MKVKRVNVEKIKAHSWQDSVSCDDIWCMGAHLVVLVPSLVMENGSKWIGVREVFDFNDDEMIGVNVRMGKLHEELRVKYLEEEKSKTLTLNCYCLTSDQKNCPIHKNTTRFYDGSY